jgi:hypothetical protein
VVYRTPPEVVSGIGRGGGGGGWRFHQEVTSVPPNTTYRTPLVLMGREGGGVRYVRGV